MNVQKLDKLILILGVLVVGLFGIAMLLIFYGDPIVNYMDVYVYFAPLIILCVFLLISSLFSRIFGFAIHKPYRPFNWFVSSVMIAGAFAINWYLF